MGITARFRIALVWAVVPCQILLVSGLRTCHGVFDISILRGLGHVGLPLIAMALGIVAHASLIPSFVDLGIAGVAVAFLLRSLLLWPLGHLFISRATELSLRQQLQPMAAPLLAAILMAVIVDAGLPVLVPLLGASFALVMGISIGGLLYPAILFAISPALVTRLVNLVSALRHRDRNRLGQLLGDTV
ncbi:MAG: polysaccharide biosynthesis C-terminal domain-containing protein [Burkholderiaceae bacterium]